jgi:nucleotide-binding universal stress UspA family protein
MKILLAVDGSEYTKRMLAWLATHEEFLARGAEYSFITVVPPLPAHMTSHVSREVLEGYHRERADEVLKPIVEFARHHGWRYDASWPVGDPAETIAHKANAGRYDLIVMGSHGHTALGSLLLGSVAQRVLATCRLPVLIVR